MLHTKLAETSVPLISGDLNIWPSEFNCMKMSTEEQSDDIACHYSKLSQIYYTSSNDTSFTEPFRRKGFLSKGHFV